jgi:uncharacterized protein (DUF58 family)
MSGEFVRRRISIGGLAMMGLGLGLAFLEIETSFLKSRLGAVGHMLILCCGTGCSVWGLKEVVAAFWPRLVARGHHFRLPLQGAMFLCMTFVLFVGSLLGRSNMLMMVFTVMAAAFIMNGWITFTMLRGARVRRDLPPRIMSGEVLSVNLEFANRNRWISAWVMRVRDTVQHAAGELTADVLFLRVPPWTKRGGSYQFCPGPRGRYVFGPLDVTSRFPLGLVQRGVRIDARQELLVYPRLGRLQPQWRRKLQHSMELVGHVRPKPGAFQDEMHRLREFRQGDDTRQIHWRTSARMNNLMVSEYYETRDLDLAVLVDAWVPPRPIASDRERLERGLRFAATLSLEYLRFSRQSSLMVRLLGKTRSEWRGDCEQHQFDVLLDHFALLEPTSQENVPQLMRELTHDLAGKRRVVLISTRPGPVRAALQQKQGQVLYDVQIYGTDEPDLKDFFEEG